MNGKEIQEALRDCGFLRDVSDGHFSQVAAIAKLVEFPAGQLIFREGEVATNLFVVLSGNVSLEICAPGVGCRRIMTLNDGDLLGWSPVLEQARLTATARAISLTKAVAISGPQLLTLCEHDPAFGYDFMRRVALAMAKRLTATRMQLLDIFGTQMPEATECEPGSFTGSGPNGTGSEPS